MHSIWGQNCQTPNFPAQDHNLNTDVLIIGGGIAGILCAYMLQQAGVEYTLVEANTICQGITRNTTAKITAQHGLIYHQMIQSIGLEKTKRYLKANQTALEKYRELCQHIDCDFESKDAFVYSQSDRKCITQEFLALQKLEIAAILKSAIPLPFSISGAVGFPNQAQFNPLKFIRAISSNLNILENTRVNEFVGTTAITERGKIHANKIIVATHFPILNKHGLYPMKLYQHRSYVIALENCPDVKGMYIDENQAGLSFRNFENLLLIGGSGHRTGKTGGGWQELFDFVQKHYPDATVKYKWATQDCMSLDGIPYIGPYSNHTEGIYVATGFNKWGMTSAMVAAMILCDMITGKSSEFSSVFSPSRSILHPQLVVNGLESIVNLLTPTTKRCPHLGCALKWNKVEHSWDCPCHGSRFTKDGKCLDNPATNNIEHI